ncbi:hypothetical protein D3C83_237720 [compost metagenome]
MFSRNANSRDRNDSNSFLAPSLFDRYASRPNETTRITTMKMMNCSASSLSSPNACTDWTTPARVMNVP